jgi:hypothetical protein
MPQGSYGWRGSTPPAARSAEAKLRLVQSVIRGSTQLLLGHVEIRHTVLYLHLSQKHLQTVASLLDALTLSAPDTARRTRLKHRR